MHDTKEVEKAITLAGSAQKLAQASGLTRAHVNYLRNGDRNMTVETAVKISSAVGRGVSVTRMMPDFDWETVRQDMRPYKRAKK